MKIQNKVENFIYGEALSDGLKTSFCILIPPLICSYFGQLYLGVSISLGVILAHIPDIPTPFKERRNNLVVTTLLIFFITFITKSINQLPILLGIALVVLCFCMSILAVFGQKASSIGQAAMLTMVLNMNSFRDLGHSPIEQALIITSGAVWYTIISLAITQFRPYRLAQQMLSECMIQVADYVRIKASFYDIDSDLDEKIDLLLKKQVDVNEKQVTVRELIYADKRLVKDSTSIGRSIVFIFSDLNDLFETVSSSHYDMVKMREDYKDEKILKVIYKILNRIANELDYIAYCINANKIPKEKVDFEKELEKLSIELDLLSKQNKNVYAFTRIYVTLKSMVSKIKYIYRFTRSTEFNENKKNPLDHFDQFRPDHQYQIKKLKGNLSLKSPHMRHTLRLTIMVLIGYLMTFILPNSIHSYWLIMTIIVIMKPGFSVTKQRNYQRLQGTVFGGLIGVFAVIFIKNESVLFALMIILMLLSYTFIRHRYVIGTMFLTAYLLLSFSIISHVNSISVLQERIIDTFLGGFLAFLSSYIIFPNWESTNTNQNIRNNLIANYNYLYYIYAKFLKNNVNETDYKLARKELFIRMAEITSMFQRMISEPKGRQKIAKDLNKITIINHMFVSYASAMNSIIKQNHEYELTDEQIKTIRKTLAQLLQTIRLFGPYENHLKYTLLEINIPIIEKIQKNNESQSINDLIENLNDISSDYYRVIKKILEQEN